MWTKNIELAIEAFNIFNDKLPNFKLIIAGMLDKKRHPHFKKLRKLASKNKNISFIINPSNKQMLLLYSMCYAISVTSFNEDWGTVPIEANAFGKSVIAINRGGFKESQLDEKTGFLVLPDKYEIAKRMEFLARNPQVNKKMGEYARKHSQIYTWANFNQQLNKLINKLT